MNSLQKPKLRGLDIFRIELALLTFSFHSNIHFNCDWGILNEFVNMGAVAMTGFFIVSGYSNYYVNENRNMNEFCEIVYFYKKRIFSIMPTYYFCGVIYAIFCGKETILDNVILFPMELLGIQTTFTSTFGLTHNGGTWFVSCILIAYILFPFFCEMIKNMSAKQRIIVIFLCIAMLLYAPIAIWRFNLSIVYANPFYRLLEFIIGMILASFHQDVGENVLFNVLSKKRIQVIEWLLMIVGVSLLRSRGIAPGDYMFYSWICLPFFILIVLGMADKKWNIPFSDIVIVGLNDIQYSFFLVQLFIWPIMRFISHVIPLHNNLVRIMTSLLICVLLAKCLFLFIEKPCKKYLLSRWKS